MVEIAGHIDIIDCSYVWTIYRFSKYKEIGEYIKSPIFSFADDGMELKWQMLLFPSGCVDFPNYLIFYLRPHNDRKIKPRMKISLTNYSKESEAITVAKQGPLCENSLCIKKSDARKFLKSNKLRITCEFAYDYVSKPIKIENGALERLKHLDDIEKLLKNDKFSDVEIVVDGGDVLNAHKCLLASKSYAFKDLFASGEDQGRCRININISYEACKEMLRYIYVGKVNKLDQIVYHLAEVADTYCIQGLKKVCEDHFLNTNCTFAEATDLLKFADVYRMDALKEKILKFIAQNRKAIIKEPSFKLGTTSYLPSHLIFDLFDAIINIDE